MSNGNWAFGSTLTRAGNPIAEITSITVPERPADWIDLTNHGSSGGVREGVPGLIEAGEVTLEGNFYGGDTLGQIAMEADRKSRTLRAYILTFPAAAAATFSFNGYVTAFKPSDAPIDGKMTFTATIHITGDSTLAVTASTGASALSAKSQADAALTLNPVFAIGTFDYVIDVANTVTGIKWTVTAAAHTITITDVFTGLDTSPSSGVETGALTIGAAASVNVFNIKVQESGKIAKTYIVRVNKAA